MKDMTEYYQAWFSAETKDQAKEILNTLTKLRLIVGGSIINGPSHFWWKGKEIDMDYFYVMAFTIAKNREAIEREYAKMSKEEVPMASFIKMDGNEKFLKFISEYTKP